MMIAKIKKSAEVLNRRLKHEKSFSGVVSMKKIASNWNVGEIRLFGNKSNPFKLLEKDATCAVITGAVIEFEPQSHPEVEIVEVISGTMRDHLKCGEWKAGDKIVYSSLEAHEPYNPDPSTDCIVKVTFVFDN